MRATLLERVYFDCDSTLSTIEGIDELGRFADAATAAELVRLTNRAMDGDVPLEEVYGQRLDMLRPKRDHVEAVGRLYVEHMVPEADRVVAALQHLGKTVGIVSGGIKPAVVVLADHLGIPRDHVHAIDLEFDDDGNYRDFDRQSPLCRNGGKCEIVSQLGEHLGFVGDGVTDLETASHVTRFVGFGGVVTREKVANAAECYVSTPSLGPVLTHLLAPDEAAELSNDHRFSALRKD